MFQIFDSPISRNNQENNVAARKHDTSNRKPLKEIEINKNISDKTLTDKTKLKFDKENISGENNINIDICSYKNVPDTYNDIMGNTYLNLFENFDRMRSTPPLAKCETDEPQIFAFEYKIPGVDFDIEDILEALEMPDN